MGMTVQHSSRGKHWRRLLALHVGVVFVMLWGIPAEAQDNARTALRHLSRAFTEIAEKATPAVVFIEVERLSGPSAFDEPLAPFEEFFEWFFRRWFSEQERPRQFQQMGQGSGFIISPDGYILTNHHVVGEAERLTVSLADGRKFTAKLIGTDPKSDVAVIKIEGLDLPTLPLGDSEALKAGEWVIAIGSAVKRRTLRQARGGQHDA